MAVQEKHRFDERRSPGSWPAHVAGFVPPLTVEQFKGGQSNPTYRLTDGAGRRYVLRRKPPGKLLPSAHAVDREFRVISALNKTDVPTPTGLRPVRGRQRGRHRLLHHGVLRRPGAVGPAAAGSARRRAGWRSTSAKFDDPGAPARRRLRGPRAGRFRPAGQLRRAPDLALGQAVQGVGDREDRGDGQAARLAAGAPAGRTTRPCWCTATTASTTWSSIRASRACWASSTGRSRPWAIRWPSSPTSACCGARRRTGAACKATISRHSACRPSRRWSPTTASCRNAPCPTPALWEFYMAYNLFRVSCIRQGVYARSLDGTASNVRAAEFGQAGAARGRARLADRRRHGGRCAMSKRKPAVAEPAPVVVERDGASAGRGDPRRGLRPVRRARLSGGDGARHHEGLRPDAGRALQPLQVQGRAAARHHRLDPGRARAASASRPWRGRASDPRAKLAAFVRVYVVRHCRLRVEALVANREISWLGAERVADIRRSRRAIRDIVVGILAEGVERGVFDPPQVDGRRDLKAMAMAMLDQWTHVSMWYGPGGGSARSRWPALRRHGVARRGRQAAVSNASRRACLVRVRAASRRCCSCLSPAARPTAGAAAARRRARSRPSWRSVGGSVPADRWRAVLIAGDNNSPAFDNGVEALRDKLVGDGRARHQRPDSPIRRGNPSLPARHRGQRVERPAHGRRRGLPRLHHQPRRRERLLPAARPSGMVEPAALDSALERGLRRAADRRDRVGLPQRHLPQRRDAPAQPHRPGGGRRRPRELRLRRRRHYTYYDQCLLQQLDGGRDLARPRAGDARLRRDARTNAWASAAVAAAALRRRGRRRPPDSRALVLPRARPGAPERRDAFHCCN